MIFALMISEFSLCVFNCFFDAIDIGRAQQWIAIGITYALRLAIFSNANCVSFSNIIKQSFGLSLRALLQIDQRNCLDFCLSISIMIKRTHREDIGRNLREAASESIPSTLGALPNR